MSRGSKIIHIPDKKKQGRKQKYWNTSQTAVWSAPLKYSNRDRKTRGMKKTPETMSTFAVMNMVWSDEGIKKLLRR